MLWDRGLFTKGAFFYDASVRVPLLMRLPGKIPAGTRVKEPVQLLDIAGTALAVAAIVWFHRPGEQVTRDILVASDDEGENSAILDRA